jgi:hypothetical protein
MVPYSRTKTALNAVRAAGEEKRGLPEELPFSPKLKMWALTWRGVWLTRRSSNGRRLLSASGKWLPATLAVWWLFAGWALLWSMWASSTKRSLACAEQPAWILTTRMRIADWGGSFRQIRRGRRRQGVSGGLWRSTPSMPARTGGQEICLSRRGSTHRH